MHVESFLFPSQILYFRFSTNEPNSFAPSSQTVLRCKVFQSSPIQITEQNLLSAFPSCVSVQSGMNKKTSEKNLTHSIEMPCKALEGRTKGEETHTFQLWEHLYTTSAKHCQAVVWPTRESAGPGAGAWAVLVYLVETYWITSNKAGLFLLGWWFAQTCTGIVGSIYFTCESLDVHSDITSGLHIY